MKNYVLALIALNFCVQGVYAQQNQVESSSKEVGGGAKFFCEGVDEQIQMSWESIVTSTPAQVRDNQNAVELHQRIDAFIEKITKQAGSADKLPNSYTRYFAQIKSAEHFYQYSIVLTNESQEEIRLAFLDSSFSESPFVSLNASQEIVIPSRSVRTLSFLSPSTIDQEHQMSLGSMMVRPSTPDSGQLHCFFQTSMDILIPRFDYGPPFVEVQNTASSLD
ncbi:MAG: hypothetical protein KDD52_06965 [Bdellovibrionales bacterium]|nr:hypothetical protein [Bdellovibrionales bacterium]